MVSTPIYQSSHWGFKIDVYKDHIESRFLGQTQVISVSNIAAVSRIPLSPQVTLSLNSGEQVALNPKNIKEFMQVISELLSKKQ